jgi:ribosome biogenesis GTPase
MPRARPPRRARGDQPLYDGRVVADFGHHVLVEDDDAQIHACSVRGRELRAVCGDRVRWQPGAHGARGVVEALLPRAHVLARPDARGRPEVLAANLDQIIVVCALAPPLDANLIDRYLVAAAFMDVGAVIVSNKSELATDVDTDAGAAILAEYEAIPYPVVRTSAKTGQGLERLSTLAAGHTSILVGQSGVGKSTLLNALRPSTDAAVGALSTRSGEGTHTTSASRLYRLPGGGEIIDSPGVREYTPHLDRSQDPVAGYREFDAPSRACRFRNCRHLDEPDCGVKAAVASKQISLRRYDSYRALALSPA